jgi:hypothetical protein
MTNAPYPLGTPGRPWGAPEIAAWRALQSKQRSYAEDVLAQVKRLDDRFELVEYGQLGEAGEAYPLVALRSRSWDERRPLALITGGVHGYETSGVHGALHFAAHDAAAYEGRFDLLIAPCVSPWAYERIQRWNPAAVDPNRSFRADSPAPESAALMRLIAPWRERFHLHIDLHETTDTDETEFRPARAARDGKTSEPGEIPDGFYLVGDTANPHLPFQAAIIDAVSKVTHIAPPDAEGLIIGETVVSPGVILYPVAELGLCASVTGARFVTTTEVYPDSPRTTPEQCNLAQVAAVRAALDFAESR